MKNRVRALLVGFVPCFGEAFVPTTPLATTCSHPATRATMSMKRPGTPLRSRIERATVAAAVATSVAILSTASVPAALAEELPPGEREGGGDASFGRGPALLPLRAV